MEFRKVTCAEKVLQALSDFEICFPHLKEKVSDFSAYAIKLSLHAEVYLMLDQKKPCGLTCFYANDNVNRVGYITLIGILKAYRGCGMGKKLILFTERQMLEKGMSSVRLEVDHDNKSAIAFYKHMGYIPDQKTEKGFYMTKEIAL